MTVARAELGVAAGPAGAPNPRIAGYHAGTNLEGRDDGVAWCSSFVQWCLAQVGIAGTGSGLARSWLDWGEPLDTPRPGCIVVLSRDDPASWKGHVGFYLRHAASRIHLLGGNQLDAVREHDYPAETLLGYRWPAPQPLRAPLCPLCGGPNQCAPAACGRFDVACWCSTATIAPQTLARIPPAQRGRACICPACAAATPLSPPPASPPPCAAPGRSARPGRDRG